MFNLSLVPIFLMHQSMYTTTVKARVLNGSLFQQIGLWAEF